MLEPAAEGGGLLRAELRIGGRSIARHQLDLVLALGCERIVCVAPSLNADLVQLQHVAEGRSARFHVISGPRALAGLVTANDEIFALADGLFAAEVAKAQLEAGTAVLVQPIDVGLAAGFERIDLSTAAAGAMRVPGRLVAQLAEMPPDCDAAATLQRLAMQAGIARRPLPPLTEGEFWNLVRSDAEAHAIEPRWVRQRLGDADGWAGPGRWLAKLSVRRFGAALLDAGSGSAAVLFGAIVLIVLGLGSGWFGLGGLALSLVGLGGIAKEAFALLAKIEHGAEAGRRADANLSWLIDGALVAVLGWSVVPHVGQLGADRYFPALMLIALLRLVPRVLSRDWLVLLEDRALLVVVLGAALVLNEASAAVHVLAVIVALLGILMPRGDFQLTRP